MGFFNLFGKNYKKLNAEIKNTIYNVTSNLISKTNDAYLKSQLVKMRDVNSQMIPIDSQAQYEENEKLLGFLLGEFSADMNGGNYRRAQILLDGFNNGNLKSPRTEILCRIAEKEDQANRLKEKLDNSWSLADGPTKDAMLKSAQIELNGIFQQINAFVVSSDRLTYVDIAENYKSATAEILSKFSKYFSDEYINKLQAEVVKTQSIFNDINTGNKKFDNILGGNTATSATSSPVPGYTPQQPSPSYSYGTQPTYGSYGGASNGSNGGSQTYQGFGTTVGAAGSPANGGAPASGPDVIDRIKDIETKIKNIDTMRAGVDQLIRNLNLEISQDNEYEKALLKKRRTLSPAEAQRMDTEILDVQANREAKETQRDVLEGRKADLNEMYKMARHIQTQQISREIDGEMERSFAELNSQLGEIAMAIVDSTKRANKQYEERQTANQVAQSVKVKKPSIDDVDVAATEEDPQKIYDRFLKDEIRLGLRK